MRLRRRQRRAQNQHHKPRPRQTTVPANAVWLPRIRVHTHPSKKGSLDGSRACLAARGPSQSSLHLSLLQNRETHARAAGATAAGTQSEPVAAPARAGPKADLKDVAHAVKDVARAVAAADVAVVAEIAKARRASALTRKANPCRMKYRHRVAQLLTRVRTLHEMNRARIAHPAATATNVAIDLRATQSVLKQESG